MFEDSTEHSAPPPPPLSRRRFMKWLTHGLGAVFAVVLGAPLVAYFIDPRNKKAAAGDFRTVARFDGEDLPLDTPVQKVIRDVRRDSWTLHPDDVIGRVWVIRKSAKPTAKSSEDKKASETLEVFTTICPHLGCSVNYEANEHLFKCPCHNGTFNLDGQKVAGPVPRNMDSIGWRIADDPDGGEAKVVQVQYESFLQGESKKIART